MTELIPCHIEKCKRPGTVFASGVWRCTQHAPTWHPSCTHSLAPSSRCAYCGAVTDD
jgi:hypothetical protein